MLLVILVTAISTLLSALFVRYRDIRPIWEVLLQTIYFISLVLIPVEAINDATLQKLLLISPFACLVEQLRHAVISASAPTVLEIFGSPWLLAIPIAIAIALCVISFIVFDRMAPKVAEEL